ncbi:MAG: mandelate racemase/muconate lactonizing enzyme family protein [Gammaproteobacteria bacterium]|jgi:L-alanine-DL-glutamate epimerase-like enolase superfamily enzyme|nr:mandelate racemase/muconate lactonizing enzyme family protein [Gammaproteobacteria bacterium]
MKVIAVESLRIAERPNLVWVRLRTDEGITGLGESWFGSGPVEADLHDRIAPLLLGEDPGNIEALNRRLRPYVGFFGSGAEMRACSAVDVALWDIAGKAAGKPIHDLLGGALRESIPVYNTCAGPDYVSKTADVRPRNFGLPGDGHQGRVYEDLDGFMNRADELAAELLDMGIRSMKIWPFDFVDSAADGLDISAAEIATALLPFEKVRESHGTGMRLKAELHGLWSLAAARKIAAALEPMGMDWIEDPVWMDHISDLGKLVQSTKAPIAAGETLGGIGQFDALLQLGGVATAIVDVTWGGGITVARQVAALARAAGKSIAFHDCSGPVTLASSTHLALACPNVVEQEITRAFYHGWYHQLVDAPPPLENGHIRTPPGPGLGLELLPELDGREDAILRVTAAS